jgi:hypothetical protein
LIVDELCSFIILTLDGLLLFLFEKDQRLADVLNAFNFIFDIFGQIKLLIIDCLFFTYLQFFEFAYGLLIELKRADDFLSLPLCLSHQSRHIEITLNHFITVNRQRNQPNLIENILAVDMVGS